MALSADVRAIKTLLAQDAARPRVDANLARLPLLDFVPAVTPHYFRPDHLAPIADELERTEGEPVRLLAHAPPRHAKTELVLHFVAWTLARHPEWTVGYASHSAALALSKSRLAREYARRAGVALKDDTDAVHEWRTTAGGGCLAAGVFGSWTGHGVNVLVVDDPYADRSEADSPLIRARVRDWYQSVASTRVEPGGSIVLTFTRWHELDLAGWILTESEERGDYQVVNLPALDGAGTALWPHRWPAAELAKKRRAVGPYEWSSLYLGAPVARGGEVFKGPPTRYAAPALDGARVVIGIDPAGTTGEASDYTAAVVLALRGADGDATADVLEVTRFKHEAAAAAAALATLATNYPGAALHIEATRDGKQIKRAWELADPRLKLCEAPPFGSKFVRAGPAAGAWTAGRLRLPLRAPWLEAFLDEVQRFTGVGDGRDDQVDALSLAWNAGQVTAAPYSSLRVGSTREWGPRAGHGRRTL